MASRLYAAMINAATPMVPNKLMPLWNHAAGPKTVFFWAPGESNQISLNEQVTYGNFSRFSIQMGEQIFENIFLKAIDCVT